MSAVRVWWLRPLTCTSCKRVTYRPHGDRRPCTWCDGELGGRA